VGCGLLRRFRMRQVEVGVPNVKILPLACKEAEIVEQT
jgi:hypothetical protein